MEAAIGWMDIQAAIDQSWDPFRSISPVHPFRYLDCKKCILQERVCLDHPPIYSRAGFGLKPVGF